MKVILLNSPIFWDPIGKNEEYLPPLGLVYIATYLKKSGINVELIDCVKEEIGVVEIINYIEKVSPEFIGINIFTQNYEIVRYILENNKVDCEIFIGGQVVKSIYQEILSWKIFNKLNIIIGEGEYIVPKIIKGQCEELPIIKEKNIRVYRVDNNSKYFPRDISNLKLDRRFLKKATNMNHYNLEEATIITSRGCIYNCAFCGGARELNNDTNIRIRTKESIIMEIKEILEIYPGVQSIRILDDLFLRNNNSIDMAIDIFSRLNSLNWRGMIHVLSLINAMDKIKLLEESGCRELFLGIESGSERIRNKINKVGNLEQIIDVATEILRVGIDLKCYFIYGFPDETEEDFESTYELAHKIKKISESMKGNFRTSVFQFRPYHGTLLYNEILQRDGVVPACEFNSSIGEYSGRAQFSFQSGNYSRESDEILNEYIMKTQKLMEES